MTIENYDEGGPKPGAEVPSYALGTYLAEVGRAIRTSLPPKAWVEAVVLDARQTRHGLTLELIEPFADDRNDGRLKCVLWSRAKASIEAELGVPLDAATVKGVQARLLLKPLFHKKYHLEGEVLGIDPTLIESLMARRMEEIRRALRAENLYGLQRQLMTPEDVTSVAVIHPDRSASWADVQTELERLALAGVLLVRSFPVPFEGPGSASRIAEVLRAIGSEQTLPDLVLIIRGGGAAAGLASLSNVALARAICCCPVPVVTGLGHASDRGLIDDLAWRAADTPSKALGVVKSILRQRCAAATKDYRSIIEGMDRLLRATLMPLLNASGSALVDAADRLSAREASRLRETVYAVERHLIACRGDIDLMRAALHGAIVSLLNSTPRVPKAARAESKELYGGILTAARSMLPRADALEGEARRSAGLVESFLARQDCGLRTARSELERLARRCLSEESSRLAAAHAAAEILDVSAVLKRGFALPLDQRRQIIRSAEAARAAESFELLIADGSVACRPVEV